MDQNNLRSAGLFLWCPLDYLRQHRACPMPLNYGLSMTVISMIIVGIDLLMKERIGFGTLFDAVLVGNMIQMFNDINPLPVNHGLATGVPIMLIGFVFMAFGQWLYMSGAQCCGPRDMLLVGIGKRLPKIPIGVVEIILLAAVVIISWLLGGPVGIGTLISVVGTGLVMQLVLSLVRFEPREVRNRDCVEVTKILLGKHDDTERGP